MSSNASTLAGEKYVVLVTRKRSGDTVATPIWIADLGDGSLGFTTDLTSGKVKRIRNFSDVTLQASNVKGVPKPGSEAVAAQATVLTGADITPVEKAIRAKYGVMVKVVNVMYGIRGLFKRGPKSPPAAIRFTL